MSLNGIDAFIFMMSTYGKDFIKRYIFPTNTLASDFFANTLVTIICVVFIITYKNI